MNKSTTLENKSIRQPHFMRLNLMNRELTRMLARLHSYQCEPCTSEMYDKFLRLNHDGHSLQDTIEKISKVLDSTTKFPKAILDEIDAVMQRYHGYQKSLTSYLSEAIIHH